MKPTLCLRIASILTVLCGIAHTFGAVTNPPDSGAMQAAALAMKNSPFDALGHSRTYWDFFMGYGISMSVTFLVQAIIFWQLGAIAKTDAYRIRNIVLAFCLGFVGWAVLAWRYFFAPPLIGELLIAAALFAAYLACRRAPVAQVI